MNLKPRPSTESTKARILCVDDEPQVLEGLTLNLSRRYEVLTATSGPAGLNVLAAEAGIAVIISDMRMPEMDGASFLSKTRQAAPDAVRILLTGHADMFSAISAVNEGQIFRFLSKPCPPPVLLTAVKSAIAQYELVISESVLLEKTLKGSIKAFTDILALTNPISFGRADRVKRLCTQMAEHMCLEHRWQLEVAAMFSHLGSITLPNEVAEKLYYGQRLTSAEWEMISKSKAVGVKLIAHIPRLEPVHEILTLAFRAGASPHDPVWGRDHARTRMADPALQRAAGVLRGALDFDACETRGIRGAKAVDALRTAQPTHDPQVLDELSRLYPRPDAVHFGMGNDMPESVRDVPISGIRPGMILAEDVNTHTGMLVATAGYEVTASFVERLRNFQGQLTKEAYRIAFYSNSGATTGVFNH